MTYLVCPLFHFLNSKRSSWCSSCWSNPCEHTTSALKPQWPFHMHPVFFSKCTSLTAPSLTGTSSAVHGCGWVFWKMHVMLLCLPLRREKIGKLQVRSARKTCSVLKFGISLCLTLDALLKGRWINDDWNHLKVFPQPCVFMDDKQTPGLWFVLVVLGRSTDELCLLSVDSKNVLLCWDK